MCAYTWGLAILRAGVLRRNSIPNMIKIELTNIPVKSGIVTTTTGNRCTEFISKVRETRFIKVKNRQVNKFNRLVARSGRELGFRETSAQSVIYNNQLQGHNKTCNNWVINLSKTPLTPAQESLLVKGTNFAIVQTSQCRLHFSN